jgi:hypothetical protein
MNIPPRLMRISLAAGATLGIVYALSPLTVWCTAALLVIVLLALRGIDGDERRWVLLIVVAAIVARFAAVAGLFAVTNHGQVAFGSFFGDEEYFIRRSIWLRNVSLGIPIHGADLIYAFDEYSATSYLYILAFIQTLVGPAPYGVHLLAIVSYLAASLLLFRMVRPTLGRMPALIGLLLLLVVPSWFIWSIAVLKESLFFLMTALCLRLAVALVRTPRWWRRVCSVLLIAAIAGGLETVRAGGAVLSLASIALGYAVVWFVTHPRWLLITCALAPIAVGAAFSRPVVQYRFAKGLWAAAGQHWGHIATAGYVYTTLDARFYPEKYVIDDMHPDEMARYVVRSFERYITVPLPWEAQSRSALAFLPEQMLWLTLVVLAPFGLLLAYRRDPLIASMLLAHAAIAAVTVALTSGNVGTLVRHRGLALPYFIWLSAVGICELVASRSPRAGAVPDRSPDISQLEGTCP